MKTFRPLMTAASLATLLFLAACSISLAQDVTPPPDYVPPVAPETQPTAPITLPMVPPDPNAGAPIYTEKCLPCHGGRGQGDGPMSSNLSSPPPSIGAVENIRAARPVDWFRMVTQGNLQNMMPGFSGSLDERQRWDVVAYALSFGFDAQSLAQGEELYAANCQQCHGADGEGNGKAPDWTDPARLAQLSEEDMRQVFAGGQGDHPSFTDTLNEGQQWAVTSYIRSRSFASAAAQAATPQATDSGIPAAGSTTQAAEQQGTPAATDGTPTAANTARITGRVVNASGGALPAGMSVTLLGYDQMQQALETQASVDADGNFEFPGVELNADRIFLATVEMNGFTFNSDMLRAADVMAGQEARVNVHVYDTTTDASSLSAERMHIFFDFPEPGKVQIGELVIISNSSNLLVTPPAEGQALINFTLPQGATDLTFQDGALGERFLQTENGFADTAAVSPGSGTSQVLFAYNLPYDGKLDVELTPPLPVTAAVIIAPADGVRVDSEQLTDSGVKDMQGISVHLYTAGGLPANSPVRIRLSGTPGSGASLDTGTTTGLIVGGISLAISVGLMVYYLASRRKRMLEEEIEEEETTGPQSVEDLVEAIVALDDLHQSGQIPEEAYNERRAALKEQLRIAREEENAR